MENRDHFASRTMEEHHADTSPVIGFIIGMSRSGTHWLAACLNQHPDLVAIGETAFWGKKFIQPRENGKYSDEQLEQLRQALRGGGRTTPPSRKLAGKKGIVSLTIDRIIQKESQVDPRELFDAIAHAVCEEEGKPYVIEKTPHHINWIERIDAYYPAAKFIVMMRNPYDFMLSYKHQGDRKEATSYHKVYHPLGCALVYRGYARSITAVRRRLGDSRAIFIDFAQILTSPENVLEQVVGFLGLRPAEIQLPARNSSFPGGIRPDLKPDDFFWLNLIASREMSDLGITRRSGDRDTLSIVMSFVRMPLWLVRVLVHLSRSVKDQRLEYLRRWLR